MDRKPLSLRCDPEQYSTLLWPLFICNHYCIRQELACYTLPLGSPSGPLYRTYIAAPVLILDANATDLKPRNLFYSVFAAPGV